MIVKIIKVSDKGQIAIPQEVRESVGIRKGDDLVLIQEGGKILLEKSTNISSRIKEDFSDLLKHSEAVARELWENEEDKIWDSV